MVSLRIVRKTAVYKYPNEKGLLLFERVRYQTDQAPPRHKVVTYRYGIGGEWATGHGVGSGVLIAEKHPEADRYLYQLPQLLEAIDARKDEVWWTEGESDANALRMYDEVATSHHGGAGRATVSQAEWFRGYRGQVLLPYDLDADDRRGGNVGALDVIRRYDLLRAVGLKAKQLVVVHGASGKDVRDHIDAGHEPDDMVPVLDIQFLRDKATRTMGTSFGRAGYAPPDTELAELLESNPEWNCKVVVGEADSGA